MRRCLPDPVDNAAGRVHAAQGVRSAVDVDKLNNVLAEIDQKEVRKRRGAFDRIYHEARSIEEPGLGISFTSMLMLLAHFKLIDYERALQ